MYLFRMPSLLLCSALFFALGAQGQTSTQPSAVPESKTESAPHAEVPPTDPSVSEPESTPGEGSVSETESMREEGWVPETESMLGEGAASETESMLSEGEVAEIWLEPEISSRRGEQIAERRILAYASTAVAVLAFGAGGTIGYFAREQYDCLQGVLACNETRDPPIEGTAYLDQVAEVEQKAVLADMMFVLGAASSVVALTNWVQGFLWTAEEQKDARALDLVAPVHLAQQGRGARP